MSGRFAYSLRRPGGFPTVCFFISQGCLVMIVVQRAKIKLVIGGRLGGGHPRVWDCEKDVNYLSPGSCSQSESRMQVVLHAACIVLSYRKVQSTSISVALPQVKDDRYSSLGRKAVRSRGTQAGGEWQKAHVCQLKLVFKWLSVPGSQREEAARGLLPPCLKPGFYFGPFLFHLLGS